MYDIIIVNLINIINMKKCSNPTCENIIAKCTYCNKCRMRKHRHGDVNIIKPKGNKEIWKLAKGGGSKHKYVYDSFILNQWSSELAWLLGWTITDGCVENTKRYVVGWMLKDREPLEIIQKLFKTNKPIEECYKINKETKEKRKYYRLRLCGKAIAQKFMEIGIEPRKTFTTKIPPIPKEFMWHFLRGVMEGDGCIMIRAGGKDNREGYLRLVVEISCGHEGFLKEIYNIKKGTIKFVDVPSKSKWVINFDCSKAVEFLTNSYKDSEGLRLSRKYKKWQAFCLAGQTYNLT